MWDVVGRPAASDWTEILQLVMLKNRALTAIPPLRPPCHRTVAGFATTAKCRTRDFSSGYSGNSAGSTSEPMLPTHDTDYEKFMFAASACGGRMLFSTIEAADRAKV
jgi:hypothetical protein